VVVSKFGVRKRNIRVQRELPGDLVIVRELDAVTPAGTARFSGARIADEDEFRISIQPPERQRALQSRKARVAQSNFRAVSSHQRIGGVRSARDAAAIVAVKSQAALQINLRFSPRTKNRGQLRTRNRVVFAAGISTGVVVHIEVIIIRANSGHGAEFFQPLNPIFKIRRNAELPDVIFARGCGNRVAVVVQFAGATLIDRLKQTVANGIAAQLQADAVFHFHSRQISEPRVTRLGAAGPAFVLLLELIALWTV